MKLFMDYKDQLLYFMDPFDGRERLVFTKVFEKRLFHAAHDAGNHLGYNPQLRTSTHSVLEELEVAQEI
jgi:hypothetical protein